MTHTLPDEQEAVLQRGGLCLASLFAPPCCLAEWSERRVAAGAFCDDELAGCSYRGIGCKSAAISSPYILAEFCEWLAAIERIDMRKKVAA